MSVPTYSYTTSFAMLPRAIHVQLRKRPNDLRVYLELLVRAAWESGPRVVNGHVVQLRAGECVFGTERLAEDLDLTRNQIRTSISTLVRTGIITTKTTTLGTIAKLLGYGENDGLGLAEPPATSPATPPATPPRDHHYLKEKTTKRRNGDTKISGVHRLRDFWLSEYKTKHGVDYVFTGADFKLLKNLESAPGVDETERRMRIAFETPPSFPPQPWSLATFLRNINACAVVTEPRKGPMSSGRVEPRAPSEYVDGEVEL